MAEPDNELRAADDRALSRHPTPCRFGYVEDDGDQYCFEHFGWHHYTERIQRCSLAFANTSGD